MARDILMRGWFGVGLFLLLTGCASPAPDSPAPRATVLQASAPKSLPAGAPVVADPVVAPQEPTPAYALGGGTLVDGPLTFDLRLFRDSNYRQDPIAPSLYSDLVGIGAYMHWSYDGAYLEGPVQVFWGTLPETGELLQDGAPFLERGSRGGRTGGVLLPGGPFLPGESKAGDRVRVALQVSSPEASFCAVLSFTLREGPLGLEPLDISTGLMSANGGS